MRKKVKAPKSVTAGDVAALFAAHYKRGALPGDRQCYSMAVAINTVRSAKPSSAISANRARNERIATYDNMKRLVSGRLELMREQYQGVKAPELLHLQALDVVLEVSRDAFFGTLDPLEGKRRGAEWHKPARYLAEYAAAALEQANRKPSLDKRGPFVCVIAAALELAGQGSRAPEAVAKVLQSPP